MTLVKFIVIAFIILLSTLNANNLALPCAGCHGSNGVSLGETIPSINNLGKKYFIEAFTEYKNGTRNNYIMKIISNGYSEKQIKILADYYDKQN